MGKKVKHSDTHLNCKIYLPPKNKKILTNEDIFPEWIGDSVKNKPNIGICFSGGGTRSAAATIGQLRALHLGLGILEKFRYLSCISGAAWALTPFYYGDIEEDETFLGKILFPEQIVYDDIMNEETENENSFIHAICSTNVVQRYMKTASTLDSRAYSKAVGEMYLEPFNCGSMDKFFTWDSESLEDILIRNPDLKKEDFYTVKRNQFPYLITGTILFSNSEINPFHKKFLFEMTPLYIGNHTLLPNGETEKEITNKRGGGYVEPQGFNTIIVDSEQEENGIQKNLPTKSDILCQKVKVSVLKPFSLCDMIGTTSAAPSYEIFKRTTSVLNIHAGFPYFNYWSPHLSKMRGVETEWLEFGDGGIVDNLGLFSMLRRKVTSIIIFLNTNRKLLVDPEIDKSIFTSQISQDICIYFGQDKYLKCMQQNKIANFEQKHDLRISNELKENFYPIKLTSYITETDFIKNHVLDDEGDKYETLIKILIEKRKSGQVPAFKDTYKVVDNLYQGIEGGWNVDILWIYNERVLEWEQKIPEKEREKFRFMEKKSPFIRFPSYRTWRENNTNLIGLKACQARLLAHLSCYVTLSVSEQIKDMLRIEIEKIEKKKNLPPPPNIVRNRAKSIRTMSKSTESFDGINYTGKSKKELRFRKLAIILLSYFKEHFNNQSNPESNLIFKTDTIICKVISHHYYNFRPNKQLSSLLIEINYKDEPPKLYKFKVTDSILASSMVMDIFSHLNDHWKENDVPARIGLYEIFSIVIDGICCGFIEYLENAEHLGYLSTSSSPRKETIESFVGFSAASLLLGIHGLTPDSFLIKDGILYVTKLNSFGLRKSRLDLIKEMIHVPDFIKSDEKWFMYSCKVAYNILPSLKELTAIVEERLKIKFGDLNQYFIKKINDTEQISNDKQNLPITQFNIVLNSEKQTIETIDQFKELVINFISNQFNSYRGNDLISILKNSIVVKLSHVVKMLKNKEYLDNVYITEPSAFVVSWNIFKVGMYNFQKITDSVDGWNVSIALHHPESRTAFIASKKTGALYKIDLKLNTQKRLLNRTWKWSESKCICYDNLTNMLYIIRSGKKYKDICRINLHENNFVKLEVSPEIFANVHKAASIPRKLNIYYIQNDYSLYCYEIEKNETRLVLPENSFQGYNDHFITCGNCFFAFGSNGVAKFDPYTAQLMQISHKTWDSGCIGMFGDETLQTFLIVNRQNGMLILWDSRSNEEKIISNWNESWVDASYVF